MAGEVISVGQTSEKTVLQENMRIIAAFIEAAAAIGFNVAVAQTLGGQALVLNITGYVAIGGLRIGGGDAADTVWQSAAGAPLAITANGGPVRIGAGTSVVSLEVDSNAVAGETPMRLTEGVAATMRRVKWKDAAALVPGDKVMVLA